MDKVHKPITTQYYTPSSKPFRITSIVNNELKTRQLLRRSKVTRQKVQSGRSLSECKLQASTFQAVYKTPSREAWCDYVGVDVWLYNVCWAIHCVECEVLRLSKRCISVCMLLFVFHWSSDWNVWPLSTLEMSDKHSVTERNVAEGRTGVPIITRTFIYDGS
jgi:hypothetical protein